MRQFLLRVFTLGMGFVCLSAGISNGADKDGFSVPAPSIDAVLASSKSDPSAVLAGGCFWGIQAVFQHVKGVISAPQDIREGLPQQLNMNW